MKHNGRSIFMFGSSCNNEKLYEDENNVLHLKSRSDFLETLHHDTKNPINEKSHSQCMKSVRIWNFFGTYFPAFGLNAERYSVSLRFHSECWKI